MRTFSKRLYRSITVLLIGFSLLIFLFSFNYQEESQLEEVKRALLVIDVQNVYFSGGYKVTYPEGSLDRIVEAMDAAQKHGIPIVVVQHTSKSESSSFSRGSEAWQLKDEVAQKPRSHLIEKNYPGCFTGTDLESWLRDNDIDVVTISGYMTQMCCDSTARQAFHRDFKVEFLTDATGTLDIENDAGKVSAEELHNAILVTQSTVFSKVLTTEEWIQSLE